MAGVPDDDLVTMAGWPLGIDNRSKETAIPSDENGRVLALRAARNVDLDAAGKPKSRPAAGLAVAMLGLHSLYASDRYPLMFGVHDGALVGFDESLEASTLHAGLLRPDPDTPMSYDVAAGVAFYSNGVDCGMVDALERRRPWAAETPAGPPQVDAYSGAGGLRAGSYQVAITYLEAGGRESAASPAVEVQVAEGEGIRLTSIPVPADAEVTQIRVYCSPANGDLLYAAQDIPPGLATYLLGAHQPGRALDTMFLSPMPAGQIVRTYGARLHVADRNLHRWSEAMRYGLGKLHHNYARYDSDITLLEPVGQAEGSGLFVAAGKRTYYLSGPEPTNWQRVIAHPHGAVPGSAQQVEASRLGFDVKGLVPLWLTTEGQFVVGLPGGTVAKLHADRYAAPAGAQRASVAMRDLDGMRHLIATLQGGHTSGLSAQDSAVAEVWKDGVRIS